MSGRGGGYDGGGAVTDFVDYCITLVISTQLSSPKDDVVSGLKVGDILQVGLHQINEALSLVVAFSEGQIAGGITSPETNRLKECILQGNNYIAAVTAINDGQVKVKITRLSKE